MDEVALETGENFPRLGLIEFDEWHSREESVDYRERHRLGRSGRMFSASVVTRGSRLCESCNPHPGETPVPLPSR